MTLISERYPERYQGIVAIGAALLVEEKENPIDFTHKPVVPLLFLTNQSELGPIQEYMENCRKLHEKDRDDTTVLPALWEVGIFSFTLPPRIEFFTTKRYGGKDTTPFRKMSDMLPFRVC